MQSMELSNIGLGAVTEKFQDELEKVVANILDPNTKAEVKRKITLTFEFAPDKENRELCDFVVEAESKLAKTRAYENKVQVGQDAEGHTDAMELIARQLSLFPEEEPAPQASSGSNVVAINQ